MTDFKEEQDKLFMTQCQSLRDSIKGCAMDKEDALYQATLVGNSGMETKWLYVDPEHLDDILENYDCMILQFFNSELRPKPFIDKIANTIFETGEHIGKTFEWVRQSKPSYFPSLLTRPAGEVIEYHDFMKYCFDYLKK